MASETDELSFQGFLGQVGNSSDLVPIGRLSLMESYNAGWRGTMVLAMRAGPGITSGVFMSSVMSLGYLPGAQAIVYLTLRSRDDGTRGYSWGTPTGSVSDTALTDGLIARSWPVVLGALEPLNTGEAGVVACTVQVFDPVTYLGDREVWGAYRGCSVGEMIGGALSMAAGSDGKPTLAPLLPGFPEMSIRTSYRSSLNWMQYAIAAGRPLRLWLADVLGQLGLRVEMLGTHEGKVDVNVTDMPPGTGSVIDATLVHPGESAAESEITVLELTGLYGQPAEPVRGAVLDDVTQGGYRRVGYGSIGNVVSAPGVDVDEVAARMQATARGRIAESFALSAQSSQPGFRPGRCAVLDEPIRGVDTWQTAGVRHRLVGESYSNALTLFTARFPWCPTLPSDSPDVVVPAVVDGGGDLHYHQPVPRDRLGRIPVRFVFLPLDAEEIARQEAADSNADGRVTDADFGGSNFSDAAHWEAETEAYAKGEMNDPYPGMGDGDLTESQLDERRQLADRRHNVRRYLAWSDISERAVADRDLDGYVTLRDSAMSDELAAAVADEGRRERLVEWHTAMEAGTLEEDFPNLAEEDQRLAVEYGRLFGADAASHEDDAVAHAALDAETAAEQWPPRLPLPVVHPMAGGLHGFIPSHRQGDACRVAVHGPFSAEVIGFQYRDDRPINSEIKEATAGFVVEHDTGQAWSGFVFRPVEDITGDGEES